MSVNTQFIGQIDEFEEGPRELIAEVAMRKEWREGKRGGSLSYPYSLVPSQARYGLAMLDISISLTSTRQYITKSVGQKSSTAEFLAVKNHLKEEFGNFTLRNPEN